MLDFYFDGKNYIIEGYDTKKPFASFLPGVAGKLGKPLWCYYVNRGQVVSSFGVADKMSPILEFSPGAIAYQRVSVDGFRTFVKVNGEYTEPFGVYKDSNVKRKMLINEASVGITEVNKTKGYEITVWYYGLPNENIAALARKVEIKNISGKKLNIELLDGLTTIIPKGVSNSAYKEVGNLMRSWMDVENLEKKVAFYKLRASSADSAEVSNIYDGNFFVSFVDDELISPIVDSKVIFDYEESMQSPINFIKGLDFDNLIQITANKTPCGFTYANKELDKDGIIIINSLYGYVEDVEFINNKVKSLNQEYFDRKFDEAYQVIRNLTNDIETKTSNPIFDEYCRQSYLDNFIRGGYPVLLDDGKDGIVYYLYSRKHGDLERDYNWFIVSPEYYSQGNGNYRDANQNRRNDVLFKSYVKEYDIRQFMNLVQIDGYNPLSVNGVTFKIDVDKKDLVINSILNKNDDRLKGYFDKFTPGQIINYLANKEKSELKHGLEESLKIVLNNATYDFEANFGEGYWSDHFTYNLDLVENYLKIYPDNLKNLLYKDETYKYFQSPIKVLPRSEKYVINKAGDVRQYGAINHHDLSKANKLNVGLNSTNWLKNSAGNVHYTNLFEKLLSLALVKFLTLDPCQIGIEMEGEKPGWNDAMNGLPGLFGSGVSETIELLRIVKFLKQSLMNVEINILKEIDDLANKTLHLLNDSLSEFAYWDKSASIREEFRELIDLVVSEEKSKVNANSYATLLDKMISKLEESIAKAKEIGNGILPSYLIYEASKYEKVLVDGKEVLSHYGLPKVKVTEFKVRALPYFLEAPARSYKVLGKDETLKIHQKVKETELFDKKLKIYRTSIDLDPETLEVGRIRAFTKGWLERESCFLHMTYKYLWGLLSSGLYDEFYEEFNTNLVANMDPEVYGRSVLENSSFIATSCNPDPTTHGKGYVSRLTGANVEFLSMWHVMMFGKNVFKYENGNLTAEFKPILKADMFDENNEVSATFMSNTKVTYVNVNRKDTYKDCSIEKMIIDGQEINSSIIANDLVFKLREGGLKNIKIILK